MVAAQAAAASLPLITKWSWKNLRWSSCSWKCCGVNTAEITGTPVSSYTRINPPITASATNSWR
jgi:hypothetical protein